MKISILTPVYNAEKTVKKTIQSVVNQEIESELEYIIVDGDSTDGSQEIINQYLEHIDIFISEKDRSPYEAMNKGICQATGDIIGIINADDWYNDGALKIVEQVFNEKDDVSIVYSPIDNYFDRKYLNTFIPGSLDKLVFKFTINHPSCFVKKSVYDKIGLFDLSYSIAADYDFILRAYLSGFKFHYIETSLASYSLNGITGSPLNKYQQLKESWKVGSEASKKYPKELQAERRKFYLIWSLKEITAFPIKLILKPQITRKIKQLLRKIIGSKLPSDQYGAW